MKLTKPQLDKLSDIPYVIPSIDKPSLNILALGFALGFWMFAIWIVKGK